ncbi:NADP-dependent 3-hydroxy acid dehydrogenase YdfG [Sagittula marina]|uniref:NADP-dependent 3-hydroxy acid dehydrogenase YdfG n=1 Tax=Sagittula marina TaxID=943940 RepID=A0A7W6DJQ5_9RHOB|nr:SDR family oxidoreductase [Sagittula marina]MBB3983844.1 NADP-dependent 3-hydroxy acid dehydrogenase YdfG [Sagittula marina]
MKITPKDGIVVVTGAGSGLGRAMARQFCAAGFTVVGMGRQAETLAKTGAGLDRFHPVVLDVSDGGAVTREFSRLRDGVGPVAVLVNNAAVYPRKDFLSETGDSFMQTVNTNLGGTVHCTRAALAGMVQTGRGRILNVATFADVAPLPTASAYAVSKGAARIFTRAVVADLGDRFPGIVMSDWMPGMLATKMGIADGLDPEVTAAWGVQLALSCDRSLTGSVFEMDHEVLEPRGLKSRLKDVILLRRKRARRVSEI